MELSIAAARLLPGHTSTRSIGINIGIMVLGQSVVVGHRHLDNSRPALHHLMVAKATSVGKENAA